MSEKPCILLVDDEEAIIKTVRARLEASGYRVLTAMDGTEGLEKARGEHPDLMILDLMLPNLDGYHVCKLLKGDTRYRKIPIIMLTARAGEKDEKLGYESGADAYLRKPFQTQELLSAIEKFIRRSAQSADA